MYRSATRATGSVVCACLAKVTSSHCHEASTSQTSTTQPGGKKAAAWFSCTTALKTRWNSEGVQEHFRVFRGDGTPCTIQDILDATADDVDVLCIGETHDDPVRALQEFDDGEVISCWLRWPTN